MPINVVLVYTIYSMQPVSCSFMKCTCNMFFEHCTNLSSCIYDPLKLVCFLRNVHLLFMLQFEFGLHNDATPADAIRHSQSLVPCLFKHDYCGIMVCTQGSESVNHIVRLGFRQAPHSFFSDSGGDRRDRPGDGR